MRFECMRRGSKYSYNPDITFRGTALLMIFPLAASINMSLKFSKLLFLAFTAFMGYIPFRLFKSTFKTGSFIKGLFLFSLMMLYSYETIFRYSHVPVLIDALATTVGSIIFLTSGLNTKYNEWVILLVAGFSGYLVPLTASMLWENAYGIETLKSMSFSLMAGVMLYAGFTTAIFSNLLEIYVSRETFLKYPL